MSTLLIVAVVVGLAVYYLFRLPKNQTVTQMKNISKKYVISANWKERNGTHPWLIRLASEHPDEAVACVEVVATGCEPGRSSKYEAGFGCAVVMHAESATWQTDEGKQWQGDARGVGLAETRLYFDMNAFFTVRDGWDDADAEPVTSMDTLVLRSDRSIWSS
ncbi:MAG: hypothetical protein IPL86_15970 [Flavobacteriales bacterium]|nr:hypothetical protein [Flavobacteriales bacterium]